MNAIVRLSVGLLGTAGLLVAGAARAQVGSIILVTTTADTTAPDGACSLREAIVASNTDSIADETAGSCQGTGPDSIRFSLGSGTPQILITAALPVVSAPVIIRGNTGGARGWSCAGRALPAPPTRAS